MVELGVFNCDTPSLQTLDSLLLEMFLYCRNKNLRKNTTQIIKVQSKLTFGLGALLLQGISLDTLSKFKAHLETLSALIPKRKSIKLKIITRLLDIYFCNNLFWKKKYNLVDAIRRLLLRFTEWCWVLYSIKISQFKLKILSDMKWVKAQLETNFQSWKTNHQGLVHQVKPLQHLRLSYHLPAMRKTLT